MVTDWPRYLREVAMGLRTMGFPISAPSLEQLAAAWDAERAQAAADRDALAEYKYQRDQNREAADKAEAALAHALALAEEWITGDGETYGAKLLAAAGRRLKSMLGGAR